MVLSRYSYSRSLNDAFQNEFDRLTKTFNLIHAIVIELRLLAYTISWIRRSGTALNWNSMNEQRTLYIGQLYFSIPNR